MKQIDYLKNLEQTLKQKIIIIDRFDSYEAKRVSIDESKTLKQQKNVIGRLRLKGEITWDFDIKEQENKDIIIKEYKEKVPLVKKLINKLKDIGIKHYYIFDSGRGMHLTIFTNLDETLTRTFYNRINALINLEDEDDSIMKRKGQSVIKVCGGYSSKTDSYKSLITEEELENKHFYKFEEIKYPKKIEINIFSNEFIKAIEEFKKRVSKKQITYDQQIINIDNCNILDYSLRNPLRKSTQRGEILAKNLAIYLRHKFDYSIAQKLMKQFCKVQNIKESIGEGWLKQFDKGFIHFSCIELRKWLKNKHPNLNLCKDCKYLEKSISQEEVIETSFLELDNKIVEQIYNNNKVYFLIYDTNTGNIEQKDVIIKDGLSYTPIMDDGVRQGAINLPNGVEDYNSVEELVEEIKQHINKYLDVSEQFLQLASWYVLLTYVYDRFRTINYLRALGDTGTGKSRFLDVIGGICYKSCCVSGSITPAPIYRIIKRWQGTLIIDESDFRDSSEKNEVITILNCGFEKNRPIIRCDKNDPDNLQFFSSYCPKIISSRRTFQDKALESRCITEKMKQTSRKDIPDSLPNEFFEEQQLLRRKLLMFRFKNYFNVNIDSGKNIDLGDIEPRLKQATRSFASLFSHIPNLINNFKEFLSRYNKDLIEERADSFDGLIVESIAKIIENSEDKLLISSSDIAKYLVKEHGFSEDKVKPRNIGLRLKSLGFTIKIIKAEGKTKRIIDFKNTDCNSIFPRYITDKKLLKIIENKVTVYGCYGSYGGVPNFNKLSNYDIIPTKVEVTPEFEEDKVTENLTPSYDRNQRNKRNYRNPKEQVYTKDFVIKILKKSKNQEINIRDLWKTCGGEDHVNNIINELKKEGVVFEPKPNLIKLL